MKLLNKIIRIIIKLNISYNGEIGSAGKYFNFVYVCIETVTVSKQ